MISIAVKKVFLSDRPFLHRVATKRMLPTIPKEVIKDPEYCRIFSEIRLLFIIAKSW